MPVIRDFLKGVRRVLKRISFGNELFLELPSCLDFLSSSLFLSLFLDLLRDLDLLSIRENKSLIFFFFQFELRKLDGNICCRIFVV